MEETEDANKYMAPFDFPFCRRVSCRGCVIKTLVFAVLLVVVGVSFSLSPGYGAAEGFDLITSSKLATVVYDFMIQSPRNVQQIAGMVLLPFYVLIVAFVVVCIMTDDTWLMITTINGWIVSLVICLCIGIPVDEQRIRYWETGTFPLEYLLSDNTVNTHLVISFICSHSMISVFGEHIVAKVVIVCYNFLLALFTIITRCSNPQAVMIALLVGIVAIYFNRAFNLKWVECQRRVAVGEPIRILCCWLRTREKGAQETDPLNGPEPYTSVQFDTRTLQHENFSSVLTGAARIKRFEISIDDAEPRDSSRDNRRGSSGAPEPQEEVKRENTEIQSSLICVKAREGPKQKPLSSFFPTKPSFAAQEGLELESILDEDEDDDDESPHSVFKRSDDS